MIRIVIGLTVGVALGVAIAAWVLAGRAEGPTVDILRPTTFIGRTATFEATVDAPDANLTIFDAHLEQNSSAHEIFSLANGTEATVRQESDTQIRDTRTFNRETHPAITAGPAKLVVRAPRPVLFGYREATTSKTIEVIVCPTSRTN